MANAFLLHIIPTAAPLHWIIQFRTFPGAARFGETSKTQLFKRNVQRYQEVVTQVIHQSVREGKCNRNNYP